MKGLKGVSNESQDSVKKADEGSKPKEKPLIRIFLYNCLENFLLFLVLLNSVIYPCASAGIYFLFAMGFTAISMVSEEKKARLKQVFSLFMALLAFGIIVGKIVFIVMLHKQGELSLTDDERLLYDSLGISIDMNQKFINFSTIFFSVFFDAIQIIISALLSLLYSSHRKEI